jgi:hypothetical protein
MVFVIRWHHPEPTFPGGPASGERLHRQQPRLPLSGAAGPPPGISAPVRDEPHPSIGGGNFASR